MKQNILKISLVVVLVLALFGLTITSFAFWDQLTQTENETIVIGEGTTVSVAAVVTVPEGKFLVPAGVVMGTNDVSSVELTYEVEIDKELVDALDLSVIASSVLIDGSAENAGLVNINIALAQATINAGDKVLVTVTVTLDEPTSQAQYDAVKNGDITFTLTFTATAA